MIACRSGDGISRSGEANRHSRESGNLAKQEKLGPRFRGDDESRAAHGLSSATIAATRSAAKRTDGENPAGDSARARGLQLASAVGAAIATTHTAGRRIYVSGLLLAEPRVGECRRNSSGVGDGEAADCLDPAGLGSVVGSSSSRMAAAGFLRHYADGHALADGESCTALDLALESIYGRL